MDKSTHTRASTDQLIHQRITNFHELSSKKQLIRSLKRQSSCSHPADVLWTILDPSLPEAVIVRSFLAVVCIASDGDGMGKSTAWSLFCSSEHTMQAIEDHTRHISTLLPELEGNGNRLCHEHDTGHAHHPKGATLLRCDDLHRFFPRRFFWRMLRGCCYPVKENLTRHGSTPDPRFTQPTELEESQTKDDSKDTFGILKGRLSL